jgi:hypothetical protein
MLGTPFHKIDLFWKIEPFRETFPQSEPFRENFPLEIRYAEVSLQSLPDYRRVLWMIHLWFIHEIPTQPAVWYCP